MIKEILEAITTTTGTEAAQVMDEEIEALPQFIIGKGITKAERKRRNNKRKISKASRQRNR